LEKQVKLKVISYDEEGNYHWCRDKRGEELRVDLMACGTLPEDTTPQSLVGKIVTCKYVYPFLVIAEGVSLDSSSSGTEGRLPLEVNAEVSRCERKP
jgi:hypothetical protein